MSKSPVRALRRRMRRIRRARERAAYAEVTAARAAGDPAPRVTPSTYAPFNPLFSVHRKLRHLRHRREESDWESARDPGPSTRRSSLKGAAAPRDGRGPSRGGRRRRRRDPSASRRPRWMRPLKAYRSWQRRRRKQADERAWAIASAHRASGESRYVKDRDLAGANWYYKWRRRQRKRFHAREIAEWEAARARGEDPGDYPTIKSGGRTLRKRAQYRIRRWKRKYRSWPKLAQVGSVLGGCLLLVGASAGYYALTTGSADQVKNIYASFGNDATEGEVTVLIAGDATAYNMGSEIGGTYADDGIFGTAYGAFGCGIAEGDAFVGDRRVETPRYCRDWVDDFKKIATSFEPQVVVLMTGTIEAYDREVNGTRLASGSAELERYLVERIDVAREALVQPMTERFLITTVPCEISIDGRPDPGRTWINGVLRRYVEGHASSAELLDLGAFACPGNRSAVTERGERVMQGLGFTSGGTKAIWRWIAEDVTEQARRSNAPAQTEAPAGEEPPPSE